MKKIKSSRDGWNRETGFELYCIQFLNSVSQDILCTLDSKSTVFATSGTRSKGFPVSWLAVFSKFLCSPHCFYYFVSSFVVVRRS